MAWEVEKQSIGLKKLQRRWGVCKEINWIIFLSAGKAVGVVLPFSSSSLFVSVLGRVHPTLQKFSWKRCFHSDYASNVFRPHYAGEVWKQNNHRSFWFEENWGGKSRDCGNVIIFEKLRPHWMNVKCKVGVFKFLRFEERFRKVPFSWRISVDGICHTAEIKLRFQISPA